MRKSCLLIIFTLIVGCAPGYQQINPNFKPEIEKQALDVYKNSPMQEVGFCLSSTKGVYNVTPGGLLYHYMPNCKRTDYVMHTHPSFDLAFPNFVDANGWDKLNKANGNFLFGVVGSDGMRCYAKEE